MFAANPVAAIAGRAFPCEDRFVASVLNGLRRNAVVQLKKVIDAKQVSQVDGLILLKTLSEQLVNLDARINNL